MKVYVLSSEVVPGSGTGTDGVFYSLEKAKEFVKRREGSELEWVAHNSHGPCWVSESIRERFVDEPNGNRQVRAVDVYFYVEELDLEP
jgi:hypothetical protein